jgi:signal transduction histidine kinase
VKALSLRARTTLASSAVLAAGLVVFTVAVNVAIDRQLRVEVSAVVRARADGQLAALDEGRDGRIRVREAANDEALDSQTWVFVDGRAVERPRASTGAQRAADELAYVRAPTERALGEEVLLFADLAYGPGGRRRAGTVVVGESLAPYERTERIALLGSIALDLFVLAAGATIAWRAVGAALRPVVAMTAQAAAWSEHGFDRRFNVGRPRDELGGLAATLDALLARIAAAMHDEQRLSEEMAHELRTPLAALRGEAELALRRGRSASELREAMARIVAVSQRLAGVIEALLTIARARAGCGAQSSDSMAGSELALEVVRPLAAAQGVGLEASDPATPLRVAADANQVAQALHPLLENAVRHARDSVRLGPRQQGESVVFEVQDDGSGLSAPDSEAIFEPGVSGVAGAGLGLALARRLARSLGGDVVAGPSAEGGSFELMLPSASVSGPEDIREQ